MGGLQSTLREHLNLVSSLKEGEKSRGNRRDEISGLGRALQLLAYVASCFLLCTQPGQDQRPFESSDKGWQLRRPCTQMVWRDGNASGH